MHLTVSHYNNVFYIPIVIIFDICRSAILGGRINLRISYYLLSHIKKGWDENKLGVIYFNHYNYTLHVNSNILCMFVYIKKERIHYGIE